MDFLKHQNEVIDLKIDQQKNYSATSKNVIVIGGGDTGSDCIGTSNRHKAKSVTNFEILDKPSTERTEENPWPYWPFTLKTSSSHEEGIDRKWSIMTKEFIGDENKNLTGIKTVAVDWKKDGDSRKLIEIEDSEKVWPCELALLALGFTGPEQDLFSSLNIELDHTMKPVTENYKTTNPKVFAAGDLRRGQSLIVWAISEGREAAYHIDKQLMGNTNLPSKIDGDLPSIK